MFNPKHKLDFLHAVVCQQRKPSRKTEAEKYAELLEKCEELNDESKLDLLTSLCKLCNLEITEEDTVAILCEKFKAEVEKLGKELEELAAKEEDEEHREEDENNLVPTLYRRDGCCF